MIETFSLASSERERKWGKIVKPMVFVSLFLLEQWKTRAFFFLRISIKEKKIYNLRGKKYLRYSIGWFLWIEKKKMEEEEYLEEFVMEPFVGGEEMDLNYEFDAPRFHDFTLPETDFEAFEAGRWFDSTKTYPPSRKHFSL